MKHHQYNARIDWTGNRGTGTRDYRSYDRDHNIAVNGKRIIEGSSDAAFRGDPSKHTPEDFLVCSLSTCHMLWYLHVCAVNNIIVTSYVDNAFGIMEENQDGSGQFIGVTLNPIVTVESSNMIKRAIELHHEAHKMCFISRSVNFDVQHKPNVIASATKDSIAV